MTPRLMLVVALLWLPATAAGHLGAATSAGRCVDHGEVDAIEADIVESMHVGLLQKDRRHEANPLEPSAGMDSVHPLELAEGSPSAGAAGAPPNASLVGKQLPDIIGDIAGNILGDVAEGLVSSLASAVSSALGPLTRILGEAVNSTNESVQTLLGKLANADLSTTEKEQVFQAEVGAVLNSTARYWERISGIATTAANASSLALGVLGQEELASQLSSVLDNVITFVDDQLSVLRRANAQIGALRDVMDDELVGQLFQVNETLSSVVGKVGEFEATIQSNITSFVDQAESTLGMSNTTALDPIERQLNVIVSLVSDAVQTVVRGVSDAAVLVVTALENDPGLKISDSTFRSAPPEPSEGGATLHSGAARTLGSFAAMAAAVVFVAP